MLQKLNRAFWAVEKAGTQAILFFFGVQGLEFHGSLGPRMLLGHSVSEQTQSDVHFSYSELTDSNIKLARRELEKELVRIYRFL